MALFVRPLLHSPFRIILPEKKPVVPLLPICSTSVPTALNCVPAPALTTTVGTLSWPVMTAVVLVALEVPPKLRMALGVEPVIKPA